VTVERRPGAVLASVSGDPERLGFLDLARALACAARVVEPGGQIILLSATRPVLGPGAQLLRQAADPAAALALLRRQQPPDRAAAFLWASAAARARLYLLSGLEPEIVEELFATPLDNAGQAQRLLAGAASCLVLEDAHKTMAVLSATAAAE
jgi:hypothetical protein